MNTVGDRIRTIRERRGWSVRELAKRSGIDNGHISRIERGDQPEDGITPRTLFAIADALRVTEDYLLGKTNQPSVSIASIATRMKPIHDTYTQEQKAELLEKIKNLPDDYREMLLAVYELLEADA